MKENIAEIYLSSEREGRRRGQGKGEREKGRETSM